MKRTNYVTLGVLLCLSSLILLYQNRWPFGLLCFVLGIYVMNKKK